MMPMTKPPRTIDDDHDQEDPQVAAVLRLGALLVGVAAARDVRCREPPAAG